jgi:hypothetical protein
MDNIKMGLKETRCEGVDWTVQWLALMNTVIYVSI